MKIRLDNLRCTVSPDDVVTLFNDEGEEVFREHQPGAYQKVLTSAAQGISIGLHANKIDHVSFIRPQ